MAAVSLAIVGKNNQPLYVKEFVTEIGSIPDESVLFGLDETTTNMTGGDYTSSLSCSLQQEFLLHSALARLDEIAGPPPGYGWRNRPGADNGMFVGLLQPMGELRVYGYCTTTKIKFILAVEDEALSSGRQQSNADDDIKSLFQSLHRLYVEEMLNPFQRLEDDGMTMTSKQFDIKVQQCIAAFNNQSEGGMI